MISRVVKVKWVDTQAIWNHTRILEIRENGEFAFQITPCEELCERCAQKLVSFPKRLWASGLPGRIEPRDMGNLVSYFLLIDSVGEFGTPEECLRRAFNAEIVG